MNTNLPVALGIRNAGPIYYQLPPAELVEHTVFAGQGELADSGALCVDTGEFTGRSPKDKFIVRDATTENEVWWGEVNQPFSTAHYQRLKEDIQSYFQSRTLYVRDAMAGADPKYQLKVRVVNEHPWQNLFVHNLFLRPTAEELATFSPDWTIFAAPGFYADPAVHGTRKHNFTVVNFSEKVILIGGSAYTGEMKKGIFSVLNFLLPLQGVLPMHCSANVGPEGTAVFFGLSGTGKTTLSADVSRKLIGDDEHAWTAETVFNFEGGCYAKCINLSAEKEPEIWNAIRFQTLVENTRFFPNTRSIDFHCTEVSENTRAAYPIHYIPNTLTPSIGGVPKNIFMLTADAFGVLPPISKLTTGQAMYHFLSGYTAKVAGTEAGVVEPEATFSACFGLPFLPLHPTRYAELLGKKLAQHPEVNVWLVNTGWTGGPYGIGHRISLKNTRAIIAAALAGALNAVEYATDPVFGLNYPTSVPNVPSEVLNPRDTWADTTAYDAKANYLAGIFNDNFAHYQDFANAEIQAAAPKVLS